jgi:hypothetical protein
MPTQLTTETATITTAAIQIQTLTIGKKQVTLAVFRQLREEPLIAEDGTLNGVPWGTVNYHPEKCIAGRHWHIVWQRGTELLRSRVEIDWPNGKFWSDDCDAFITAHVCEVLVGRARYFNRAMPPFYGDTVTLSKEAPFPVEMAYDDKLERAVSAWSEWRSAVDKAERSPNNEYFRNDVKYSRERLEHEVKRLDSPPPEPGEVDALFAAFKASVAAEVERRERHRETRAALADLPQMFIAV